MDPSLYQSTTSKSSDSSSDDKLGNDIVDYDLQNRIDNDIIEEQVEEVLASRQDLEPETPPAKSFVNLQSPLRKKTLSSKESSQTDNWENDNSKDTRHSIGGLYPNDGSSLRDNLYSSAPRRRVSQSSVHTTDLMDHRMHHHQPQPRDYTPHQRSFMQRRHSLSQGSTSRSRSEAALKGKGKASTDSAPVLTGPNFNGYPSRHNSKSYNNLSSSPTSPVVNRDSSNFSPPSDPFDPPNDMNIRSRSKTIADFIRHRSFSSVSDHSHMFGSEPASRRSSIDSSLVDVCLPIDAQGNVSPSGQGPFDMSYLDEFAENERREHQALEESLSMQAAHYMDNVSSNVFKSHTVNEANILEGQRLRPYRVVPWKNGSLPQQQLSSSKGPNVAYGGFKAPDDFNTRNRKNNRYFDPYFTGIHDHSYHTGPPLRFTYFREDLESTVHSPSISGLLQDNQVFDDLFNLANAPAQTPVDVGSLTPQLSNIAVSAAKQALNMDRNIQSRVSSPLPPTLHPQIPTRGVPNINNINKNASSTSIIDAYASSSASPSPANPALSYSQPANNATVRNSSLGHHGISSISGVAAASAAATAATMAQVNGANTPIGHTETLGTNPPGSIRNNTRQYDPSPFWLDIMNPTEDEMKAISKSFGIHPLTTEDIMLNEPREKVELFRNYYLVCFRSFDINDEKSKIRASAAYAEEKALKRDKRRRYKTKNEDYSFDDDVNDGINGNLNGTISSKISGSHKHQHSRYSLSGAHKRKSRKSKDSELTPLNMYMIVFHEGVLTFHLSPTPHPMNVRRRIRLLRDYISLSSDWISYALIDDITDGFAPMIEAIEEEVNCIEEEILSMHSDWSDNSSSSSSESESDSSSDSDDGRRKSRSMKNGYSSKLNSNNNSDTEFQSSRYSRTKNATTEKFRKLRHTAEYAKEFAATMSRRDEEERNIGMNSSNAGTTHTNPDSGLKPKTSRKRGSRNSRGSGSGRGGSKLVGLNSRLSAQRWARGSTVDPPTGGILGNAKNAELFRQNAAIGDSNSDDSDDSERNIAEMETDTINDYTDADPPLSPKSSNKSKGLNSFSNKSSLSRKNSGGKASLVDVEEEFDPSRNIQVPGALTSHIYVDDEEDDDDFYEPYDHNSARQSLLSHGKTNGNYQTLRGSRGSGDAISIRSSKTHKSSKSRKSSSSRRSRNSKSSSASSSSWSSTASGRWKEKGDMLRRIGECRKRIMSVLRLLGSKADVIKGFSKRCNEQWEVAPRYEIGLYLGDIQDHIVTMVQSLNHYEKLLARSHSNYLAQINIDMTRVNNDMNDVLSKITVLGTIVLPMNIVTGLWGMNVLVPGQNVESLTWFWSITGALFVFGCISFVIARRVYGIA